MTVKLKKMDRRFALFNRGYSVYLDFNVAGYGWNKFARAVAYCKKTYGRDLIIGQGRWIYNDEWRIGDMEKGNRYTRRIYFRSEATATLALLAAS